MFFKAATVWSAINPDYYFCLFFSWLQINNPTFNDPDLYPLGPSGPGWGKQTLPQINNRTFKFPGFSLLSQFDDERAAEGDYDQILCEVEQDGFENCDTEFCACTQYIKVDLGQVSRERNLRVLPLHRFSADNFPPGKKLSWTLTSFIKWLDKTKIIDFIAFSRQNAKHTYIKQIIIISFVIVFTITATA